jgi:hypothetical protein
LGRTPWADEESFPKIDSVASEAYRSKGGVTVTLQAQLEDVQTVLARALKPNRKLITAVQFSGDRIVEIASKPSADPEDEPTKLGAIPKTAVVAATVAAPTIGCPMPEFAEVDVRANRVLESFLTEGQTEDYRKHGTFLAIGHDTGRRYLVAHREQPRALRLCGGRQLYDVEDRLPLCVHDWTVPPAEEMLALLLCLRLPGREREIRHLPETWA